MIDKSDALSDQLAGNTFDEIGSRFDERNPSREKINVVVEKRDEIYSPQQIREAENNAKKEEADVEKRVKEESLKILCKNEITKIKNALKPGSRKLEEVDGVLKYRDLVSRHSYYYDKQTCEDIAENIKRLFLKLTDSWEIDSIVEITPSHTEKVRYAIEYFIQEKSAS